MKKVAIILEETGGVVQVTIQKTPEVTDEDSVLQYAKMAYAALHEFAEMAAKAGLTIEAEVVKPEILKN